MKQKKWVALFCMMLAVVLLAACASTLPNGSPGQGQKVKVNVAALNGPTGIGMVKLWDEQNNGLAKNNYKFTFSGAPDELVGKLTSGEVDIAALPINLAGALYNKTNGNIQILALNTLGVLYVLENGSTVQTLADLSGKTLYASGQGEHAGIRAELFARPERREEHKSGIQGRTCRTGGADGVRRREAGHAARAVRNDGVEQKSETSRIALDLNGLWRTTTAAKGNQTDLAMGCLVIRKDFAAQNQKAVSDFLIEYKASVDYVNANVTEAAALVQQAGIMPSAVLAAKAIPNCNIVCITGDAMKSAVTKLYGIFFQANPKSIGGAMPKDDFYYVAAK